MTRFIPNSNHSRHFAASEIVEFDKGRQYSNGYGQYYTAKLRDGSIATIDGYDIDGLFNPVVAVLPAADGYNVVHAGVCRNGEEYLYLIPVIAWHHMADGSVRPVTVRGENDSEPGAPTIEAPNGKIFYLPEGDTIFPNMESFTACLREAEAVKAATREPQPQPEEQA